MSSEYTIDDVTKKTGTWGHIGTSNASGLQGLKNRLISTIDSINDENKLQEYLDLLHENSMPCTFTEEELDEEIKQSETSEYITHEEALAKFAKWGFSTKAF